MPETMTVIGPQSKRSRIRKCLGMGLYLAVLGGAVAATNKIHEEGEFDGRKSSIRSLIYDRDFPAATRLISSFKEEGLLRSEDAVMLDLQLERWKGEVQFYQLLDENQLEEARELFTELQKKEIYPHSRIDQFRETLASYSEEGLYAQVLGSPPNYKVEMAQKYLELYEDGPHRKEVTAQLLTSSLENLEHLAQKLTLFPEMYASLQETNSLFAQHVGGETTLPGVRLPPTLVASLRESLHKELPSGDFEVGSYVVVHENSADPGWAENYMDGYSMKYHFERQHTFPVGSPGKIVHSEGMTLIVEFFETTTYLWTRNWNNLGKNFAQYMMVELARYPSPTQFEKELLDKEITTLEGLLKRYS